MKNDKELVRILLGFDDFVNMVLQYESSSEGRRVTRLDKILLNGNDSSVALHLQIITCLPQKKIRY
jgi:small nuclear ribonucleoprotein (snRNP)-like protein